MSVLCNSASRRGRKASNSSSFTASSTSRGCIVFFPPRAAFSLDLDGHQYGWGQVVHIEARELDLVYSL